MPPSATNGKICYVEIPTGDVEASAAFYREVFGWSIRTRGDGSTAFDDGVGEVSGSFVRNRPPSSGDPGLLIYVMVDDINDTIAKITANGGAVVQPVGADAPEITARFRDPAGNILGVYQQRR